MKTIFVALWIALLIFAPAPASMAAQPPVPNFVVCIADDVGADDLGCYGHPHIRTPRIDRLAREGMRFDSAFLTCSSCSPSRASIMTSRYPHNTGAAELHMPLPAEQTVFVGLLKQAGYYTAAAGKWHLGDAARVHFDRIEGGGPSGCEEWVEVLRDRPTEPPFFLWLAAFDAHRDYEAGTIAEPHTEQDAVVPPYLPDLPETRRDLAMYYDEISRFDDYVGRVLDELERQGVADNTLVLVMSDNGRPFPRAKTRVYDSGIRTPLVIRFPGTAPEGTVTSGLVSSIDIAPTLLELAGIPRPEEFQGKSIADVLADPLAEVRDYVFAEHNWHDYQAHQRAVRSARWLYIRNAFPRLPCTPPADAVRSPTYQAMLKLDEELRLPDSQRGCLATPRPAEELYDVVADPFQIRNLASAEDHAPDLERMRLELDEWIQQTGDQIPDSPTPDRFDRTTGRRLPASP